MITVMSTTSKVMFGYTVFVSSFSYLTKINRQYGGGVLSPHTWGLFPLYVSTQYSCTFFYFYELANAFSKLSTTVLLCLEARLQEKVKKRSPSPLP